MNEITKNELIAAILTAGVTQSLDPGKGTFENALSHYRLILKALNQENQQKP